jgi:hypothetical protein
VLVGGAGAGVVHLYSASAVIRVLVGVDVIYLLNCGFLMVEFLVVNVEFLGQLITH